MKNFLIKLKNTISNFKYPMFKSDTIVSFNLIKKLFILYWIFALLGHYAEIVWSKFHHFIDNGYIWHPNMPTIIPLASPYGIGAVAIIVIVWPLVKKYNVKPLTVFILNIIITGIIEYLCALYVVMAYGSNLFWDYSNQRFNINGYVSLESVMVFSVAATLFLYLFYPVCNKAIHRLDQQQLNILFWILFTIHAIDLLYLAIK